MSEPAEQAAGQTTNPTTANPETPQPWCLTRWVYLRLLGIVHLMAFASYAAQIIGLNGADGVIPTTSFLKAISTQLGPERFWLVPTLAWFNSSDVFIQAMANAGVVLSLMVIMGVCTGPCLTLLAVLWLSLVSGGGEFTGFQSDGMLVEATALSLFVAPWCLFEPPWPVRKSWRRQLPASKVGIWLIRLMIFRFMFASGVVKIASHDPTWADLTALHYHFETQPLPTPLAWYASQSPMFVLKALVVGMFISELVAPLLVLGTSMMRYIGCMMICALQIGIILTGNYTFLNYLTIVLAVSMLDDGFFTNVLLEKILPKRFRTAIQESVEQPAQAWGKLRGRIMLLLAAPFYFLASGALITTLFERQGIFADASELVAPFHIADHYGVFAVMTTTRPEIIFEGSNDGKTWLPYELQNKPDDPHRAPPWVAPHMPRLSWRLWFSAMGAPAQSPWVLSLVEKMLEGAPSVMPFFQHNPFPEHPPKYIRAWTYEYHFTDAATRAKNGDWWWRNDKKLWLPPITLRDGVMHPAHLEPGV